MNYTTNATELGPLRSIHPRLFEIDKSMFYMPELFMFYKEIVDEVLLLKDVEISGNICKYCDYLLSMPRLNFTYSEFKIHKNGRSLAFL